MKQSTISAINTKLGRVMPDVAKLQEVNSNLSTLSTYMQSIFGHITRTVSFIAFNLLSTGVFPLPLF